MALYLEYRHTDNMLIQSLQDAFVNRPLGDNLKMAIPPLLSAAQAVCLLLLYQHITLIPLELAQQSRVLAVAALAMVLLKQRLTPQQWVSLGGLVLGLLLTHNWAYEGRKEFFDTTDGVFLYGIFWALMSNICGALSLIMTEMYIKEEAPMPIEGQQRVTVGQLPSLWVRIIQLTLFSIVLYIVENALLLAIAPEDESRITNSAEWLHPAVWFLLVVDVLGELLVLLVLKYVDSTHMQLMYSVGVALSYVMVSVWTGGYFLFFPSFLGLVVAIGCAYSFLFPIPACQRALEECTGQAGNAAAGYQSMQPSGVNNTRGGGVLLVPPGLDNSVAESLMTEQEMTSSNLKQEPEKSGVAFVPPSVPQFVPSSTPP